MCASGSRICAGIRVEIFQLTDYKSREENYYSSMLAKADIEKEIIKYTEGIQGAILHQEEENILYFPIPGLYKKNLTSGSF